MKHPSHPRKSVPIRGSVPFGCQLSARAFVRQILTYDSVPLSLLCVFLLGDLCDKIPV
jgi:hypothetical protein